MSEKLYRITYSLPQCRADIDGFHRSGIYPAKTLARYTDQELGRELVGEGPPDLVEVKTRAELIEQVKGLRNWINSPIAKRLGWGGLRTVGVGGPNMRRDWCTDSGDIAASKLALPLVYDLIVAAIDLGCWREPVPPSRMSKEEALIVLNTIEAYAAEAISPSTVASTPEPEGKGWILATEALTRLSFIHGGLPGLYKFAEENPSKLHIRQHPEHKRRRQVNAADVLRLEMEYDRREFEAMDSPAADALPSVSEGGLARLAERVAHTRADKQK